MSPGNVELIQIFASWLATLPALAVILAVDESRMDNEKRARAWTPASRDVVIFGAWLVGTIYGVVGLLAHFTRTRRSVGGAFIGLLFAALLLAVDVAAEFGAAALIDRLGL